jgi:DNA recombination protein RmuC
MDTLIIIIAAVLLVVVVMVFAMALKSAKNDKQQALDALRQANQDAVSGLKDSYERTISELKDGYACQLQDVKSGHERQLQELKTGHERQVQELKTGHERQIQELKEGYVRELNELKIGYDKSVSDLKKSHEEALMRQLETVKAQVTAESEKMLKAREDELEKKAKQTFEAITGGLNKDIKDMKEAFEKNKEAHTQTSQSLKENLESAVKHLREQTISIGTKADNLADALRGQNKTQGNWGETILDNMFANEGMRLGRDYDSEVVLKDEKGVAIINEDTSKGLRPDFILHYPDGNDIVIDSKVNMTALAEYVNATDEDARKADAERNLEAIKEQIDKLAKKDYSRYLQPGHKMLDFVIMFVPVYSALRLAYESDRNLWQYGYKKGVLITTEETLMPFLRMIRIAWTSQEQIANQKDIIATAETILARVSDFCAAHAKMGKKLEEAMEHYETCDKKIRERGQSIVGAANRLLKLGVPGNPKKQIPPEIGMEEVDG